MLTPSFPKWRPVFALFLGLMVGACATETLKPTFSTVSGLQRPDRILVYDFAVTPEESALKGIVGSGLEPSRVQSEEEIRVGRALSQALSENLVSELRSRGIHALAAAGAPVPGNTTALVRGRFMQSGPGGDKAVGFSLGSREVRARIQVFQGTELGLRLVSEAESVTPSRLTRGATAEAIDADAKRAATALAERIIEYYRKQGWLN